MAADMFPGCHKSSLINTGVNKDCDGQTVAVTIYTQEPATEPTGLA